MNRLKSLSYMKSLSYRNKDYYVRLYIQNCRRVSIKTYRYDCIETNRCIYNYTLCSDLVRVTRI